MKINYESIIKILVLLVFCGFYGLENYITLLALAVIIFTGREKYVLTKEVVSLAVILLLHTIIYTKNYSIPSLDWFAKNFLNPVILMIIGGWLCKESSAVNSLWCLIAGLFIHGALNVCHYLIYPSSLINRTMANIWGGSITATLQNLLFVPIVAMLFYGVFISKNKNEIFFIILGTVVALYSSIITASRTIIYLLVILTTISFMICTKNIGETKKKAKIVLGVIVILFICLICYEINLFNIKSWLNNSALSERLSGEKDTDTLTNNLRWVLSSNVIEALKTNPFGKLESLRYAHNLFLDMARYTGVFPCVLLLGWSIRNLVSCVVNLRKVADICYMVVFVVSIGIFLVFFTEPILEGMPIIFSGFCYCCGIINTFGGKFKKWRVTK